jgi:hypothetical protein
MANIINNKHIKMASLNSQSRIHEIFPYKTITSNY